MAKPKQPPLPGTERRGFIARVGVRATFAAGSFGLVFAAFQVQGTKMPQPLAWLLVGLLLAGAGTAILSIVWEAIKEFRLWREIRETSTAWIAKEPPGRLDYEPDMKRASRKFSRQMGRLTRENERLTKRMNRHARSLKVALLFGGRAGQLWANHMAKGTFRTATFFEKRTGNLRATVGEFARAQEGYLSIQPAPTTDEDRAALRDALASVQGRSAATAGAITATQGYRDAVHEFAQTDASRTLRVSSSRLAEQLDAMILVLRRSLKDSQRLETLFEQKAQS